MGDFVAVLVWFVVPACVGAFIAHKRGARWMVRTGIREQLREEERLRREQAYYEAQADRVARQRRQQGVIDHYDY